MKLSRATRERWTLPLVAALAIIILLVYAAYVIGPLQRAVVNRTRQVRTAREALKALETATANEASLQEQYRQLDQSVASLRDVLPAEEELPAAIALLTDLASQAQVKIQTIFPQRSGATRRADESLSTEEPLVYKEVLIQIDAVAGYHQLGTFLSLVESADTPMRVANLRISAHAKEPKRHQIKLLIKTYFETKPS